MDPLTVGLLGIALLLVLIMLGLHIGLAMGLVGVLGIAVLKGLPVAVGVAAFKPYTWSSMYSLSVLPLFVLMGYFALQGGVSRDLYDVAYKWAGRLPGGLAMASVAASAAFGACTGSSIATCAAMGRVSLPEMKRYNYDDKLATGAIAAAGTLGVVMPPSINAVLYAVTCELSVGSQLVAGVIPAIFSALIYMLMILIRAKLTPSLGPPAKGITWVESLRSIWKVSFPVLVFIVMIGGIFAVVFTPTEGGAFGAFATFIIAFVRKGMSWNNFKEALVGSTSIVGLSFLILMAAGLFSAFLALSTIPGSLGSFFAGINLPKTVIVMIMLSIFLPLGMFIDSISMILLIMPTLYPVVQQIGVDPIWFGVLVIVMIEIGLITPPLGINVYVVKGLVPDVPTEDIFKGIAWFVVMDLVTVGILILFPSLSTWLPSKMG